MNKSKYFSHLLLAIGLAVIISSGTFAQNGRYHSNRGGGRYYNSGVRYNGSRNYVSIGIGNRGYRSYDNYRSGYRPYYGYGSGYNYYPSYHYRPVYRSPFGYSHFGPAFGLRLSILPFGYSPFFIGNDPFYYYHGVYYRPYADGGYEVTAPPLGATVKHLPSGSKATVINGQKYYELGGTFYQEEMSPKNKLQYVVVGTDGVINTPDDQNEVRPEDAPPAPTPNGAPETPLQGSSLNQLPANSKVVVISQQKYYMAPSGVYYQEVIDAKNNVSYEVVGGDGAPNSSNL